MTVIGANSVGVQLNNVVNSVAYYPATSAASPYVDDPASPPSFFRDIGDSAIPGVVSVDTGIAAASTDRTQLVYFSVVSDKALTAAAGGYVVLFATAMGTSGGEKLIPLAFVGDAVGNGDFCPKVSGCLLRNTINSTDYYFAYNYVPTQTVLVGLYPADICLAFSAMNGGIAASGCSGSTALTNAAAGNSMQIHFYVSTVAANTDLGGATLLNGLLSPAPPEAAPTAVPLIFEQLTAPPAISSCNSTNSTFLADVYAPGDGQIIVDTSRFAGIASGLVAPLTQVIVVGNSGAGAVIKSAYADGSNAIAQRTNLGGGQSVGGFTNTITGTDNQYDLAFWVRDAAGIVVTGQGTCQLTGVQTSQIQGFLSKSSCFIATAAYRSNDAAPVMMLRRFRDSILEKSGPGRSFVKWYYHWSPGAAEWLMLNPTYRYPVLFALIPVEVAAWSLLNPLWAGLILISLFLIFALTLAMTRGRVSNEI